MSEIVCGVCVCVWLMTISNVKMTKVYCWLWDRGVLTCTDMDDEGSDKLLGVQGPR